MKKRLKIKLRLPLFIALLAVVPVLALSGIVTHLNTVSAQKTTRALLESQTGAAVRFLSNFYTTQETDLIYAAHLDMYRQYLQAPGAGTDALRRDIEAIQKVAVDTDDRIENIYLVSLDGLILVCPDHSYIGRRPESPEAFRSARDEGTGGHEILRREGHPLLQVGYPVAAADGGTLGVIMRSLHTDEIDAYVRELRIGRSGQLFILAPEGWLLSYADPQLPAQFDSNTLLQGFAEQVRLGGLPSAGTFSYRQDGAQIEACYATEPITGCVAVSALPTAETYASAVLVNRIILLAALVSGVLALLFGLLFAHGITRPLSRLTRNLNDIADGNLDTTLPCRGGDELSEVCEAVNVMSHKLKVSYQLLESSAKTDVLTGLLNRAGVYEIIAAKFDNRAQAAILFDLDGFKQVNDSYGHDCGDAVLVEVAARLKKLESEAVHPARFGGDEFFVYISGYEKPEQVTALGQDILAEVAGVRSAAGQSIRISASVGIAFSDKNDSGREALIKKADLAMYHVKRSGKNGVFVYPNPLERL